MSRRAYGSGGLSQRADGIWVGTLEAGWTETGKRRRITVSSKDKAVAAWKLEQKKRELARAVSTASTPGRPLDC